MIQYQEIIDYDFDPLTVTGYTRLADGAFIPNDPANRDYQEMVTLVDAGEAEILPSKPPSGEEEQEQEQQEMISTATDPNQVYQSLNVLVNKVDPATFTEQEAEILAPYYNPWSVASVSYIVGDLVRYDEKVYQCIQPNTSQPGWEPPNVPALWIVFVDPNGPPVAWKQPLGAQDAYRQGATVLHVGFTWESTVASNVWEPGVYGWVQV